MGGFLDREKQGGEVGGMMSCQACSSLTAVKEGLMENYKYLTRNSHNREGIKGHNYNFSYFDLKIDEKVVKRRRLK